MSYGPFEGRSEILWWGLAVAFTATVLYVGYLFVGTFVAALFLYYGTRPFNRRIERVVGTPGRAALVTLLAVTIPLTVLVVVTTALGIGQLLAVEAAQVEGVVQLFFPGFDPSALPETPDQLLAEARAATGEGEGTGAVQRALGVALGVVGAFATALIHALLALVFVFYLLKEDASIAAWFRGMVGEGSRADRYATAVDSDLTSVYYGTLLLIFVTAVIAAVFYYASNLVAPEPLGVPLPMLMALLTGVCMFVPVVITKLVYVPLTLYLGIVAFETNPDLLWYPAAFLAAAFVVLDLVPNALAPYLAGRSVHTGLMILTYIVGPLLFGWYGVFLGPLVMVVVLEFYRLVLPGLVRGEPVVGTAAAADGRSADAPTPVGPPVADDVNGGESEPAGAADEQLPADESASEGGERGDDATTGGDAGDDAADQRGSE